jgi:hypothetical protein
VEVPYFDTAVLDGKENHKSLKFQTSIPQKNKRVQALVCKDMLHPNTAGF